VRSDRDQTAEDRDERARAHDEQSDARDGRADARDKRADVREQSAGVVDAAAVSDRAGALRDRRGGASDRTQAADDRHAAASDRILAAHERAADCIDQLTGAHRRESGLVEFEREIARAKRTKQPFTAAFVDVDQLKQTNDAHGHAAGDRRLRHVADTIRAKLRSYDLIVRYGGDEFVCALPDLTMTQASQRFSLVNADLAQAGEACVSVGFTELHADDRLEDLIGRADEAMYQARQRARLSAS
jgi:diguanylate cyclase (GGDEF)-like protein